MTTFPNVPLIVKVNLQRFRSGPCFRELFAPWARFTPCGAVGAGLAVERRPMPVASCDARPCAPRRVYGCFMCIGRNRGAGKRDPGVSCVTSTEKGGARLRNPAAGRLQTRPASPLHLQPSCCEGAGARGRQDVIAILLRAKECRLCYGAVQAVPGYSRSAGCACERVQALQAP